eukprot:750414-Hanusia_phi.AAC.1
MSKQAVHRRKKYNDRKGKEKYTSAEDENKKNENKQEEKKRKRRRRKDRRFKGEKEREKATASWD